MWFQDFANSLLLELQLPNKPLPRQKPTAETFSDTPLPVSMCRFFRQKSAGIGYTSALNFNYFLYGHFKV